MRIALAQLAAVATNWKSNIESHLAWVDRASSFKADAIFFPELSLTGYEPLFAKELAFDANDPRLDPFKSRAAQGNIVIGIGLPTKHAEGIRISMLIFQPDRSVIMYSKQMLHADEEPFFIRGNSSLLLTISGKKLTPAICYESMQPEHLVVALQNGTEIYLASVAKSAEGMHRARDYFGKISARHRLPVLLVNSVGPADNFIASGESAIWSAEGKLIKSLEGEEGLLIYEE